MLGVVDVSQIFGYGGDDKSGRDLPLLDWMCGVVEEEGKYWRWDLAEVVISSCFGDGGVFFVYSAEVREGRVSYH